MSAYYSAFPQWYPLLEDKFLSLPQIRPKIGDPHMILFGLFHRSFAYNNPNFFQITYTSQKNQEKASFERFLHTLNRCHYIFLLCITHNSTAFFLWCRFLFSICPNAHLITTPFSFQEICSMFFYSYFCASSLGMKITGITVTTVESSSKTPLLSYLI